MHGRERRLSSRAARRHRCRAARARDGCSATGSTGRNAGGVRHQFSNDANIRLSIESIALLERFADEVGQPIDFHQDGYLFLLSTPSSVGDVPEERRAAAEPRRRRRNGSTPTRRRASRRARRRRRARRHLLRRDGIADPERRHHGLRARRRRRAGVAIERDTEVTGIDVERRPRRRASRRRADGSTTPDRRERRRARTRARSARWPASTCRSTRTAATSSSRVDKRAAAARCVSGVAHHGDRLRDDVLFPSRRRRPAVRHGRSATSRRRSIRPSGGIFCPR